MCFVDIDPVPLSTPKGAPMCDGEWVKENIFFLQQSFPSMTPGRTPLPLRASLWLWRKSYVHTWNHRPDENTGASRLTDTQPPGPRGGHAECLSRTMCERAPLPVPDPRRHPAVPSACHSPVPLAHPPPPEPLTQQGWTRSDEGGEKLSEYGITPGSKDIDVPVREPFACPLL